MGTPTTPRPRKRRLTKGETFTFTRDEKTGETLVRCLFCDASHPVRNAWEHVCKETRNDESKA